MTMINQYGDEVPEPFRADDEQVKEALEELECDTIDNTGIRKISGGFANAKIVDWDDYSFDIELKFGIQSDCENSVDTEFYTMDRLTLRIDD